MRKAEIEVLVDAAQRARKFRLHPLGFFYLRNTGVQRVRKRVHVWLWKGECQPEHDVHSHCFDIESLVVVGKIGSELFKFRETTEGAVFEFAVSYDPSTSVLQRTGRRGALDRIGSFETIAGGRYCLEAGVIHRVGVDAVPCVTVLRTLERGVPIYSYGPADEEQPFVRRLAKGDEVQRIAMAVEDAIRC